MSTRAVDRHLKELYLHIFNIPMIPEPKSIVLNILVLTELVIPELTPQACSDAINTFRDIETALKPLFQLQLSLQNEEMWGENQGIS